jgi:capsular polysaccharide biosynthesis protein
MVMLQVGVHGSGLLNALYMRKGSSLVEVRPYGLNGSWPNAYMKVGERGRAHPPLAQTAHA